MESKIDHDTWQQAELTVHAELCNRSDRVVETTLKARIGDIATSEDFSLQPGETRWIKLTPGEHPQLKLQHRAYGGLGNWANLIFTP